jgi:hypothetical protein
VGTGVLVGEGVGVGGTGVRVRVGAGVEDGTGVAVDGVPAAYSTTRRGAKAAFSRDARLIAVWLLVVTPSVTAPFPNTREVTSTEVQAFAAKAPEDPMAREASAGALA